MSIFTHLGIMAHKKRNVKSFATRVGIPNINIGSSIRGGTTHLRHKNRVAFSRVKVVIPLFAAKMLSNVGQDVDLPGNITAACSIEYPFNSGVRYSFTFQGNVLPTTTAAGVDGLLISDWLDLGFSIPANTNFGSFTFISTDAGVVMYSNCFSGGTSTGANEGVEFTTGTPVNKTVSGSVADSFTFGLGPAMFLTEGSLPCAAIWGDSIADGANDSSQGDSNGNRGYLAKYCYRENCGYVKLTVPGESIGTNQAVRWSRRLALMALSGSNYLISRYGTNDVTLGTSTTLAQLQVAKAAEFAVYDSILPSAHKILCDFMPHTSSSDSYQTQIGQSPSSANWSPLVGGVRDDYNSWIDTLPLGVVAVLNSSPFCENGSTGTWVVTGASNYATTDGIHPQPVIHTAIANGLPSGILV